VASWLVLSDIFPSLRNRKTFFPNAMMKRRRRT
jgi:hypothetical protein